MNEWLILIGLLVVELMLYFMPLKSGSSRVKRTRNIRFLSFMMIVALMTSGLIEWSFRLYGLTVLWLVLLLRNHVSVMKEKNSLRLSSNNKRLINTVFVSLLLIITMMPAFIFPSYQPLSTTGTYQVKQTTFVLEDDSRSESFTNQNNARQIGIRVWYPENKTSASPLIIYSHGGISLNTSNESLFNELASHGYIVFSIAHHYHSIVSKDLQGNLVWINRTYLHELSTENPRDNPENSVRLYNKWMTLRTGDIHFVIEHAKLKATNHDSAFNYSLIDLDKIAVIGHSLGGSAALCAGKTNTDIKAVIALESPYMCDILGVDNGAFIIDDTPFLVPVFNIYSDSTFNQLSNMPQYEQNHRLLLDDTHNTSHSHIQGTGHFSLTDLALTSPLLTRLFNGFKSTQDAKDVLYQINRESLAFLEQHLNHD